MCSAPAPILTWNEFSSNDCQVSARASVFASVARSSSDNLAFIGLPFDSDPGQPAVDLV